MEVTIGSMVSKTVGWQPPITPMEFPTLEEVKALRKKINANDTTEAISAYIKIFRYHRFLRSGQNEEEYKIQSELWEAWKNGSTIFDNKFIKSKD